MWKGSIMTNINQISSTVNPNMPIRGLMYFSRLYEGYISSHKLNIYGRKVVNLPTPHYIVFYNGLEEIPDKTVLQFLNAVLLSLTSTMVIMKEH